MTINENEIASFLILGTYWSKPIVDVMVFVLVL